MNHMKTLSGVMNDLIKEGYDGNCRFENGTLLNSDGEKIDLDGLELVETYRFEGNTDPNDMSILYQLENNKGDKLILVDSFGAESDPELSDFVKAIQEK